jgi:hypothetical protein
MIREDQQHKLSIQNIHEPVRPDVAARHYHEDLCEFAVAWEPVFEL